MAELGIIAIPPPAHTMRECDPPKKDTRASGFVVFQNRNRSGRYMEQMSHDNTQKSQPACQVDVHFVAQRWWAKEKNKKQLLLICSDCAGWNSRVVRFYLKPEIGKKRMLSGNGDGSLLRRLDSFHSNFDAIRLKPSPLALLSSVFHNFHLLTHFIDSCPLILSHFNAFEKPKQKWLQLSALLIKGTDSICLGQTPLNNNNWSRCGRYKQD
jgi:hypothetical protein